MPTFKDPNNLNGGHGGQRSVSLANANSGRPAFDIDFVDARSAIAKSDAAMAPERIYEPRCKTCQHPYRDFIETMLVRGHPYMTIQNRVSPPIDRRSISTHFKKHMDLQDAALRAILEEEAKIQDRNFEEGVQDAITKRGVLEIAMRKGYEDLINGVTTVEARDLIQIAKVLAEMDSQQHSVGLDELRSQVQIFIQAIKDVCDTDIQDAIAQRVKQLRNREGIETRMEQVIEPSQAELTASQEPDWEKYEEAVEVVVTEEEI